MRWEYRTIKIEAHGWLGGKVDERELDEPLNRLGQQGWELVTAFDTNMSGGDTRFILLTLKRAVG